MSADATGGEIVLQEAFALHQNGRLSEAAALYRKILAQDPRNPDAMHLLGVIALQQGNAAGATVLIANAIKIDAGKSSYYANLALAFHNLRRFDDALRCLDQALRLSPNDAHALNLRGNVLRDLKRNDEALSEYARALSASPGSAEILNNRGAVLKDMGRLEQALDSFARALKIKPDYVEALSNRGAVLAELRRYDEAIADYSEATRLWPNYPEALNNWGNALSALKQFDGAVERYDRAIALKPDYADAYYNRGFTFYDTRRFADAVSSFDKAIAIVPGYAAAFNGRAVALAASGRLVEAVVDFDRAIALQSDYVEVHYNRANVLGDLKRFDEALVSYERAFAIRPEYPLLQGARLLCKLKMCAWAGIEDDIRTMGAAIERGEDAASPAALLATSLPPSLQRRGAEAFVQKYYPANAAPPMRCPSRGRIRIAYFSADFHDHATAHLMAELFERHDRTRFEVTGISFGSQKRDEMRARLERAFDRFVDVTAWSDSKIASHARELEIDIAVDLKGFTEGSRPGVFAMRAAPVQVSFLGYAGTTGASYMDYLIADRIVIPEEQRGNYTERVIYLPNSYQPNGAIAPMPRPLSRAEYGLPERGVVFCCFNSPYKIMPDIFGIWMDLLRQIEGSVLWLYDDNPFASQNLRTAAEAQGIEVQRLVFAKHCPHREHLARQQAADVFLDTLPYNAHTTASDALRMGVPVITCVGESFPGRVGASLLSALGMRELNCKDLQEYKALATRLATDPGYLRDIRLKVAAALRQMPLFDSARFAADLEDLYCQIHYETKQNSV